MKRIMAAIALTLVSFQVRAGEMPKTTAYYWSSVQEKYEHQVVKLTITHLTPCSGNNAAPIPKHKGFMANTVYKGTGGNLVSGGTFLIAVPTWAVEDVLALFF